MRVFNRIRTVIVLLLAVSCSLQELSAQDMLGAVSGNYSGLTGLQLNPSSMNSSKLYLDINLLGAGFTVQNNYLYQSRHDYRISNFLNPGYEWPTHMEEYGTEERIFYHYGNTRLKSMFTNIRVNGPGVMLLYGDHAFAVTTAARTVVSASDLPYEVANFAYLGLNYRPQHNINYQDDRPFSAGTLSWAEIGLSYSWNFLSKGYNSLSAGISVKRLMGYSGGYLRVKNLDYIVPNDCTMIIKNIDAEYGFSVPVDYDQNSFWNEKTFTGGGFGMDIGLTYTHRSRFHQRQYFTRLCAQQIEEYDYRIGLALVDFGAIRFNTHAAEYSIENQDAYWTHLTSFKFQNIGQLMDTLSYQFYGDNTTAYKGDKVTVWLPTALTLQFDYHVFNNWFANAALIYGVPMSKSALRRPSVLAVTPRYETAKFGVELPLSLYDWTLPRVGLALRAYWLTIGTDKLGGFFSMSDFTGMDIYFMVKIGFDKGICTYKVKDDCADRGFRR